MTVDGCESVQSDSARGRFDLERFWADERGATAVEYGLICALVFLVVVTAITAFGNKTANVMNQVSNAIAAAI